MFGPGHSFARNWGDLFQRRAELGGHEMRLGDMFGFRHNRRDRWADFFNRHTQDQPSEAAPEQPSAPEVPVDPVAPPAQVAAPERRFANPFMPISNQPITFGSMLSRQPNYN